MQNMADLGNIAGCQDIADVSGKVSFINGSNA